MINQKNYKLLLLTTFSFTITTTLFQNCSPVKLSKNIDQSSSNISEGLSYAPKSVSGNQVITNGNVVLKEYRYKPSNRFFYTGRVNDQSLLETNYASLFEVTGNTITVKAATDAGLSPVYRLFNKTGFHFYTAEINDRTTYLTDAKYQDEGIEGYAVKINQNATCPTSPSATYPVYRLSHNGSYKYRLVTDAALKSQLLAHDYSDEGIVFCATAVSSAVGSGGACLWTWADDFSSLAPANRPRPTTGCTSTNDGQKQNGVAGAADWTCSCTAPPPVIPPVATGTASCNFGNTTLAHGATATGFSMATGSCTSQSVTCTNRNLSNPSFNLNACPSVAPPLPPVATDSCPERASNTEMEISKIHQRWVTGGWSYMTTPVVPYIYQDMGYVGAQYIVKLNVRAADTTRGLPIWRLPALSYGEQGSPSLRIGAISKSKCDYSSYPTTGRFGTGTATGNIYVAVNDPGRSDESGHEMLNLTTGIWYINVKTTSGHGQALIEWFGYYVD